MSIDLVHDDVEKALIKVNKIKSERITSDINLSGDINKLVFFVFFYL